MIRAIGGDEAESLSAALTALGRSSADEVLAEQAGRRVVVRAGEVVRANFRDLGNESVAAAKAR